MASDPLAAEHAALNRWVQEAIESVGAGQYWKDVELKSLPSGRILLEAPPEQARRYLFAALAQARQCDDPAARYAGRHTVAAVSALLRRSLPLEKEDLIRLLNWCTGLRDFYQAPVAYVTKALWRCPCDKGAATLCGLARRRLEPA